MQCTSLCTYTPLVTVPLKTKLELRQCNNIVNKPNCYCYSTVIIIHLHPLPLSFPPLRSRHHDARSSLVEIYEGRFYPSRSPSRHISPSPTCAHLPFPVPRSPTPDPRLFSPWPPPPFPTRSRPPSNFVSKLPELPYSIPPQSINSSRTLIVNDRQVFPHRVAWFGSRIRVARPAEWVTGYCLISGRPDDEHFFVCGCPRVTSSQSAS